MGPVDLGGRVAFVTGAARGIGRAVTLRLIEVGATVVANVRNTSEATEQLNADAAAIAADRLVLFEGDVGDASFANSAMKLVFDRFKKLDVLVNNAGILRDAYIGMISDADIEETLSVNVAGLIRLTQSMSRLMKRQRAGTIINLASIIGRRGNVAQMLYGASKAAAIGATLSAAKELAPYGIRVNAVAPGLIDTAMTAQLPAEMRDKLTGQIGLGRTGTPDDVANVILFLASDLSSYVTGQVLGVDGGLVL